MTTDSQIAINRKKQKDQTERIRTKLVELMNEQKLTAALMERVDPKHFIQACMTHYLSGGSNMSKVDPLTFVKACVEAAQLGLKPDPVLGECYIIPRQISIKKPDKTWEKKWVAQFQMGYRGVAKLVRRSDRVRDISPHVVYANDHFDVRLGTDGQIEHPPWRRSRMARSRSAWSHATNSTRPRTQAETLATRIGATSGRSSMGRWP
jgi:phage RecT family recombinase